MRFDIVLLRIVFAAFLMTAGYVLHPIPGRRLVSTAVAATIAIAIILFEMRIRRASLKTLIGAAVGSILGIVGAYLIGIINHQPGVGGGATRKPRVPDARFDLLHGVCRFDGRRGEG